ncbi:Putative teichuronic acid biosynthesis glycosyltransferase TuaC [Maioricimonas rarisocia]|uniref:Teichuronic acid biosynthesis glycosyltransferase TuaC n=1 Tax=Maioricimonas rarisocia TaxID=2528026 RepID=A0A517ZC93_9PLAN|nr:glycosyltransferase [Maioricimonas rarisocia]QDU40123.1 Putative teichuronic acid biosynthesis glycosyltransferase TuaC [Maioricimonas rarisocia]
MTATSTPLVDTSGCASTAGSMRRQVRGSVLLLAGRGCSILLNLATQVVIVRSLSKTDYGALAYALSIVEMAALAAAFSMDKTFARFGAMYHERREFARLSGAFAFACLWPFLIGSAFIGTLLLAGGPISGWLDLDPTALSMLLLLAWLVPVNAFASVVLSLLTVLRGARSVFFRKHLFGPTLKLIVVASVVTLGGSPVQIAGGLLAVGLCGLLVDGWMAGRLLHEEGLLARLGTRRPEIPAREFLAFGLPMLSSDAAFLARGTLIVVFLGWLGTAEATASFRAVLPVVRLNELVIINFSVMFTAVASRLFARDATGELAALYRNSSLWIMTLSFPVFAGCVALARPVTVTMFGGAYADAATLLVILATGYFIQASYGFNGRLLKIMGLVRETVLIDVLATVVTLTLAWLAIPRFGAVGAAASVSLGIALHCVLKAVSLRLLTDIRIQRDRGSRATFVTTLVAAGLATVALVTGPGWLTGSLLAIGSSVIVLLVCRTSLETETIFPELTRNPLFRRWLASPTAEGHDMTDSTPAGADDTQTASPSGLRIAYMMSRFPKITETFILREMVEMQRLGGTVEVFPLRRERTKVIHPEAAPFVERAHFTPMMSASILAANVRRFVKSPVRYVQTLSTLVRVNWGSRRYLTGAILFFPKAVRLAERMQQEKIDHLHAHFASHPAAVAWVIHQLTGIPYSFTAHGSDLHRDRHMLAEKVRDAAAVVTISDYNRRLIIDECGPDSADQVHVIHCGIDPHEFAPRTEPTEFERGDGPFQIVCVGTLHEVKGQRYLLEACARLAEQGKPVLCHLVGDGPDQAMLESLTNELGISESVRIHGRRTGPEIRALLQQVDLLVAPSVPTRNGRREGIPVVLMEAMGCNVAVIGSDLSGIPELVRHELTGLLTPPRDSEAIAEAVARLRDDDTLRTTLADAGRELVLREFNLSRNTLKLKHLIESLRDGAQRTVDSSVSSSDPYPQEEPACLC